MSGTVSPITTPDLAMPTTVKVSVVAQLLLMIIGFLWLYVQPPLPLEQPSQLVPVIAALGSLMGIALSVLLLGGYGWVRQLLLAVTVIGIPQLLTTLPPTVSNGADSRDRTSGREPMYLRGARTSLFSLSARLVSPKTDNTPRGL
jgi:hypothetical protein